MSIPMFIPEDIAGKGFLKLKAMVELSGIETMYSLYFLWVLSTQDGGRRKEATVTCLFIVKENKKNKIKIKIKEILNQEK